MTPVSASASPTMNSPRGAGLRLSLGLPIAAIVSAGLFLVMGGLINNGEDIAIAEDYKSPVIDFLREPPPETQTTEELRPDRLTAETPPPPDTTWERTDGPDPITYDPPVSETITPDGGTVGTFSINSAVLQFNPDYPQRCASRGIEGSVTVTFDVLATGAIANERVVRSSDGCFDRAALEAIRKWKFMPVAGQSGVVHRGVSKTFVFRLQG